jgi:ADP-ribose pyrophosphatase YjhB (NUDIX family)
MRETRLLADAQRLQALAQAGIAYATSAYDLERYEEIRRLSVKLLGEITDEPYERIVQAFASETGYQTPKVDIRAVLLRDERMLLVQEKIDANRWTLPGGWADVGLTPFEVAEKEVAEEAGLRVRAVRLLALLDKRNHAHPPQPWYVYKAFIQCEVEGGELAQDTAETAGARWFRREELSGLPLSTDRVTLVQVETMFRLAADPTLPVLCD